MPYRWRWPALVALLVAEAMNLLDSTIVTVAAPVIHGRLGGPVFAIGVAGFVLTSVACALAPSAGVLIAARVVQGATAALIVPQTLG